VSHSETDSIDPLTNRQRELLDFIQDSVGRESRMPSYREMAQALGLSAVGSVQDLVKALVEKGYLEKSASGLKSLKKSKETRKQLKLAGARQTPVVRVPIVGEVAAGSLRDVFEVALGSLPISPDLLSRGFAPDQGFALRVQGESMIEAGILPGDLVVVDRNAQVRTGDIAVVEYRGETTLKEIEIPVRGSRNPVRLIPKNRTMKPIIVDAPEEMRVLGKVVALHRALA